MWGGSWSCWGEPGAVTEAVRMPAFNQPVFLGCLLCAGHSIRSVWGEVRVGPREMGRRSCAREEEVFPGFL